MRGGKPCTGHKDMVRTGRKIRENGVGRFIYNGRKIGVEDRGMDLDLGWRIGVGFAKRLNQDSDGSKRAGLRGDANGSDSAESENKNQCARCANHDEPLPESAAKAVTEG